MNNPHHAALHAVSQLRYSGANLVVALHWLSSWRKGQPPRLHGFSADAVWQHKPAMMICRVVKGKSITCVQGGALMRLLLGFDVTHTDILALVPQDLRAAELERAWAITEGAITVIYRTIKSKEGGEGQAQGISLPFAGEDAEGARHILVHTNWRPAGTDWIIGNIGVDLRNDAGRGMISFMQDAPALPKVVNL